MLAENVVQQAVFNKNVGSESSPTGDSAKSLEKYAASAEATPRPIRAAMTDEMEGLDVTQHGEEAYIAAGGGLVAAVHGGKAGTIPGMVAAPAASTC